MNSQKNLSHNKFNSLALSRSKKSPLAKLKDYLIKDDKVKKLKFHLIMARFVFSNLHGELYSSAEPKTNRLIIFWGGGVVNIEFLVAVLLNLEK